MSDRTYWLIEMQGPAWLMIQEMAGGKHHGYVWTGDVQEALRFYSERQAELVMMAVRQDHRDLFPTCLIREPRPTEHMWVTQSLADLPEQPFNYRHPSKYGTDVPRRCYLEELTPEERAIRDLVDTVERLGAHPLLTATVIQLMKAGEDLADWVDIGLRDKDIAALSPGNDLGLLDDGQRPDDLSNSLPSAPAATDDDWEDSCGDINCDECHGPRPSVSDYSRGAQDAIDSIPRMEGDSAEYYRGYDATIESVGPVGADVPEDERDETWAPPPGYTYIPTQGERCVCVNLMQDGIGNFFCCNQRGEAPAEAERLSVVTDQDRVEPIIQPSADAERAEIPDVEAILGGKAPFVFQSGGLIDEPPSTQIMGRFKDGGQDWLQTNHPPTELTDKFLGYYRLGVMQDYWQRGINDRLSGVPYSDCPYGVHSLARELWSDGWADKPYTRDEYGRAAAETGETQSELDSSQGEGDDRVDLKDDTPPVLDAEPSPILRSDLDPSTETFLAPSGDEFAKKNGETRLIVADQSEADGQAHTQPQDAYAPIHEVGDAPVFGHGILQEVEAKAEADKPSVMERITGMFGKKLVGEDA